MSVLKGLLGKVFSRDRRLAERKQSPELSAFYWTGAAPVDHSIRDISSTGLYLLTEERWYPGTVVMMTLQKKDQPENSPERAIAVQSKTVRWGTDGVGLQFILPDAGLRRDSQSTHAEGADRKTLEKFLQGFGPDNGTASVQYVVPAAIDKPGAKGAKL
jgi:hypothetical protein